MKDFFIQNILIKNVRDIHDFAIQLDDKKRKHLIITGKNGSGKTSTLLEIDNLLKSLINNKFQTVLQYENHIKNYKSNIARYKENINNAQKQIQIQNEEKNKLSVDNNESKVEQIENNIKSYKSNIINYQKKIVDSEKNIKKWQEFIDDFSKVDLTFSNQSDIYKKIVERTFILAFFMAQRVNTPSVSNVIQNIKLDKKYTTDTKSLHKRFIEYIVKLRVDMLDAKEAKEFEEVKRIQNWFDNFEKTLKELFGEDELKLKYYRKDLNFKIEYAGKSFGLNELSDGYSSLLAVLTELILRMEAHNASNYDMQGLVLIDEIETHLHVELQKKVLPFLVSFFPKIQFIVTTH
ncbi:MAG: AAA family ATPase, partial [Verrucomicrobiota bacterium]|nr:AAA family ATPase [Verrucomicrobiota bacterium]